MPIAQDKPGTGAACDCSAVVRPGRATCGANRTHTPCAVWGARRMGLRWWRCAACGNAVDRTGAKPAHSQVDHSDWATYLGTSGWRL